MASRPYISEAINKHAKELGKSKKDGVCLISFDVDTNGSVTTLKALTMEGSPIARLAINAIKNGPAWIPGSVDGKLVKTTKVQPVTFMLKEPEKQ